MLSGGSGCRPGVAAARPGDTVGCAIGWRCANWCAALMPKAQYNEYGNAAHGLYLAHTDRLNADLLAFIKS